MLEEWNWLESLPLESLIAMARVMGRSGFKVPEYLEWNTPIWEVAIWNGLMWEAQ